MAQDATKIAFPSRPWLQPILQLEDLTTVADALQKRYGVSPSELLWKMLEFKLVNDEVAPLDKMNFLGLLCKVRAGQGLRFRFEDKDDKITPLMRYWDELEIFRCADGCQALATKMANEIQSKGFQYKHSSKVKLNLRTAIKTIDISQSKGPGVEIGSRKVIDQQHEKLAGGKLDVGRFDYVILAVPPSVWRDIFFAPPPWDPRIEIGVMHMDPAVKFFTDVKERFWIKRGLAPSGGSSTLGQIWEGTDNQTRITLGKIPDPRRGVIEVKQGIVLSVFAGPILPGGLTPNATDCMRELTSLFPDYPANRNKTLFSNWPSEPFIKTGYASPRPGEIFKIAQKLNQPFHNLLFFAGEHTRMDFFGYMEGALRSGERAAKQLMLKFCGKEPAPLRVASAA
jgi:Monoamine oxidase